MAVNYPASARARLRRGLLGRKRRRLRVGGVVLVGGELAREDVQPHHRPGLARTDLDEVAELVGEPEAAATLLGEAGTQPPDQLVFYPTAVLHLGDKAAVLPPEAQRPGAAAVHDA